jgi:hypothetical protein
MVNFDKNEVVAHWRKLLAILKRFDLVKMLTRPPWRLCMLFLEEAHLGEYFTIFGALTWSTTTLGGISLYLCYFWRL